MVDYLSTTISITASWYTNKLKAVVERRGFKPNFSVMGWGGVCPKLTKPTQNPTGVFMFHLEFAQKIGVCVQTEQSGMWETPGH